MMMRATSRTTRLHAASIAFLMVAAVTSLASIDSDPTPAAAPPRHQDGVAPLPTVESPVVPEVPPAPSRAASRGPARRGGAATAPLVTTDESGAAATTTAPSSGGGSSGSSFAQKYPEQANATTDPSDPAGNHWALLIGINDYAGSTRDNVGSYQDARELRKHLISLGWRSDHIALIANRDATASRIIQGIRWLASKTDPSSTVVFHYSGHEKPLRTSSDGDNESMDVALWVADNKLILDGVLGREMDRVAAARMWIDLAVCRAGGFSDAGMIKPGRVLTFSSPQSELSYEDPAVDHSVFGWYVIMEGLRQGLGDVNGDGVVTVEEAFSYGRPYVTQRTGGRQHPKITDKLGGELDLTPPPPAPAEEHPPDGSGGGCGFPWLCGPSTRQI